MPTSQTFLLYAPFRPAKQRTYPFVRFGHTQAHTRLTDKTSPLSWRGTRHSKPTSRLHHSLADKTPPLSDLAIDASTTNTARCQELPHDAARPRSPASHPRIFALARSSQQPAQARPHTRPSKRIALAHAAAPVGVAPGSAPRWATRSEAREARPRQLRARSWPGSGARTGQARHGL